MAGDNRSQDKKVQDWILPVIGILIALAIAWGIGQLQARETYKRQHIPTAYAAAAKKDAERTCIGTDPSVVLRCVKEKVETAYQTAHDEQDLSAQQRAASSALLTSVFSFMALVLSGVSVWLLKTTFDETRKSNKIAKRALELEHRPAMVPRGHTAEDMYAGKVWIRANFRNASKATIRVVSVTTVKQPDTDMPSTEQNFENLDFLTPDETLEINLGSFNDRDWLRRIDVAIQYHAVNSPTIYQTDATASVTMLRNQAGQPSPELRWIALTVSEKSE